MERKTFHGHVDDIAAERGWIIGWFQDKVPELKQDAFEIKWCKSAKGEKGGTDKPASTLGILIRGKLRFEIGEGDEKKEVILAKEGDFVFWGPGVKHRWESLEDSLALAIRWPSIK